MALPDSLARTERCRLRLSALLTTGTVNDGSLRSLALCRSVFSALSE